MANPILVTGAAGRVGGVGRTITELLLKQGKAVRAMVRNEDERARALRDMGAEVVVGDLLGLDSMHTVIAGCEAMYFGMSVSDTYLAATVNAAGGGEVSGHQGVHQYVADDGLSDEHYRNYSESTAQVALARRTGAELVRSAGCARAADSVSRRLLSDFDSGFSQGIRSERLPFGEGKTSPVAVEDVARSITALLANPQPHIGKIYHLTGPQSETCISMRKSIRRRSVARLLIRTSRSSHGGTNYSSAVGRFT
jgi:uncharacterized protein YbjT (DUF2867 family)